MGSRFPAPALLLAMVLLAGCMRGLPADSGGAGGAPVPPAAAASGGTPADLAAPFGHPVVARHDLPGGRVLAVGPATGSMPAVRRPVGLLAAAAGGWQLLGTADLPLPGAAVTLTRRDLPGHPDALLLAGRLDGGETRYAAVDVGADRLQVLDPYQLTAPAPALVTGAFLYVDKFLNQLWYYQDGRLVRHFPVATGRQRHGPAPGWQDYASNFYTPEGRYTIGVKRLNPTYFGSDTHPPAAGGAPDNPLGTRWLGFSVLAGDGANIWGIHGTDAPRDLGRWVSDGCVRLFTPDVEWLYDRIPVGTPLLVVPGGESGLAAAPSGAAAASR